MNYEEMPMGLGFKLATNERAMENFSRLTDEEKQQVISAARGVSSRSEMNKIVNQLETNFYDNIF